MKICHRHYSHQVMPNAKFESNSFLTFRDMTSQNKSLVSDIFHWEMGLAFK